MNKTPDNALNNALIPDNQASNGNSATPWIPARFNGFQNSNSNRREGEALDPECIQACLPALMGAIDEGVVICEAHERVLLMNPVAESITGWKQTEAKQYRLTEVFRFPNERITALFHNTVRNVLHTEKTPSQSMLPHHLTIIAKDGTERICGLQCAHLSTHQDQIVGAILILKDLTERQRLEQKLLQFSQLESVGFLAGGIAHDFNNLLTGILGNIALAKSASKPTDTAFQRLNEAENASLRARDLTRQLLTLAKGGTPVKRLTVIGDVLVESATFALRGSKVRCDWSIPKDLWPIEVDIGQIGQVVQNLVINAEQAMPEGGVITIHCVNTTIRERQPAPLQDGHYINITITDQGTGISPEHLEKVFDPYFTTKANGSGLGLATSYAIVARHDGMITVESTLGKGTTFDIYLPASAQPLPLEQKTEPEDIRDSSGTGKVLIMDDETVIQELIGRMLRNAGYEVDFANDGVAALQAYKHARDEGHPFDVVIMDLTIPGGMGGKKAIQELLVLDPRARGVVSSGYPNDPVMVDFTEYGFKDCIAKPYKFNELNRILKQVIGGSNQ